MHLRLSKLGALILAAVIALVAITNDTTVLLSILVGASIVTIISVTLILKGPAKLDKNEEKT